jgi:hypothetical protein
MRLPVAAFFPPTDAAEWLFSWADVGTLVNVHG